MKHGRRSIDRVLEEHERAVAATRVARISGPDVHPLAEIAVHAHGDGHWHFVTLGLSELEAKVSEDPDRSGWGFELTLRAPGGSEPPRWPVRTLRQLAEYVVGARSPLAEGHFVDLGGPLDDEVPSITALALAADPELRTMTTPNGPLAFLQVVGLHPDEAALAARWSVRELLAVLRVRDPDLIIRPDRRSVLEDPAVAAELERRSILEGAGAVTAVAGTLQWRIHGWLRKSIEVSVGPAKVARRNLLTMLPEILHGRSVHIMSEGRVLAFHLGTYPHWGTHGEKLHVEVTRDVLARLMDLLESEKTRLVAAGFGTFQLHLVD